MATPPPLEDYAMIGDGASAALVSRFGSIDFLCWPRFDSPSCFAALLGTGAHGAWSLAPSGPFQSRQRYVGDTMVLQTSFTTATGEASITDFMPVGAASPAVIRLVEGLAGSVDLSMRLALRFGYGLTVPLLNAAGAVTAIAGPDLAVIRAPVGLTCNGGDVTAAFTVRAGGSVPLVLQYGPSHLPAPASVDAALCLRATTAYWTDWTAKLHCAGPYAAAVRRSLLVLKALIYAPTGAMVAAPATSLPEQPGGTRNWDYRYCWLRDSALAVRALLRAGCTDEALAWRGWLQRAIGGDPAGLRIMYGVAGEPHLPEWQADWLPGYQGARPVRIGNGAHGQLQIDVFGEVMDTLHAMGDPGDSWALQTGLIEHLAQIWTQPDEGIWEVRGGRRRFVFSQAMAWVAMDRAIRTAEAHALPAPLDRWRALRAEMHAAVCRDGFDAAQNSFVQSFGSRDLDASALQLPLLGFLPPDDRRMTGTVAAIALGLLAGGLVQRYRTEAGADGLPPGEGAFLACSFWLVECYAQQGRVAEATALFERLLGLASETGLLAEEYDTVAGRLAGNYPQAFSHLALVNAAMALAEAGA